MNNHNVTLADRVTTCAVCSKTLTTDGTGCMFVWSADGTRYLACCGCRHMVQDRYDAEIKRYGASSGALPWYLFPVQPPGTVTGHKCRTCGGNWREFGMAHGECLDNRCHIQRRGIM